MLRTEKIAKLLELFDLHKSGMALRDEYTAAKFDFLVEEGKMDRQIPREAKDKAKLEYQYELQNIAVTSTSIVDIHVAQEYIMQIQKNSFTPKQIAYLTDKAKGISLREYFDAIEALTF